MLKIYFHISLSSALKATFLLPPADIILAWIFRDRCEFATYFVEASLIVLEGYKSFFLTEKLCFFLFASLLLNFNYLFK